MNVLALLTLVLVCSSSLSAQTITTLPLQRSAICPKDSVDVSFEAIGTFESNNLFKVQLSRDNFQNFSNVGSIKGTTSGVIRIGIPDNTPEYPDYRLRVISTSPYSLGTDNGTNIFIPSRYGYHTGSNKYAGLVTDTFKFAALKDHVTSTAPYTYIWDFGEGAVPKTGYGNPAPPIVYETSGRKQPQVTILFGSGCSYTMPMRLVVAECFPKIPNDARIIDPDTSYGPKASKHVWVRSGATYFASDSETVYAEAGASIDGGDQYTTLIYLKPGAEQLGTYDALVVYTDGVSGGHIKCPSLNFDYSEAPTPEQYASVSSEKPDFNIRRIGDRLEIATADRYVRDIQIFDILGRSFYKQSGAGAISIAGWTSGKYIVRVNFGATAMSKLFSINFRSR
jgi:hypothetical protein